jgi:AcrR family transcriptional regulator
MKSSMKLNNGPPSTNKPKRRRPQERPEELAASALRLFTERGYYSTTVDDVAKAAGVTKGAVYHHFDSKEELLITAVRNFFTAAISHMEDLLRGAPDLSPVERVRRILSAGARVWCRPEFTAIFTIVFGEAGSGIDGLRKLFLDEGPRRAWPVLIDTIREGQRTGAFTKKLDLETIVPSVTSAVALQCMFLGATGVTSRAMQSMVSRNIDAFLELFERDPAKNWTKKS